MDGQHQSTILELIMWTIACTLVILSLASFIMQMDKQNVVTGNEIKTKDLVVPVLEILEREEFEETELECYDGELSSAEVVTFLYELDNYKGIIVINNTIIHPEFLTSMRKGTNSNVLSLLSDDATYTRYYYLNSKKEIASIAFEVKQ